MLHRRDLISWLTVAMLFAGSLALPGATLERQGSQAIAQREIAPTRVDWLPKAGDYERLTLTVTGPGDFYAQRDFAPGEVPSFSSFDAQGNRLPDGVYAYELRAVSRPDLKLARKPWVQSGYLWVHEGSFVDKRLLPNVTPKDIVQNDDLIVQGEACVGPECVNGDSDGHTLKVKKELAPTIALHAPGVLHPATRDWALQAGDVSGTGSFLIRSLTDNLGVQTTPFTIGWGAPDNSLTISGSGLLGVGTLTPAVRLDVKASAAGQAAARLQNSSATGYSGIQYLDSAGNVDLFFGIDNAASTTLLNSVNNNPIVILTNTTERIRFPAPGGNVITAANGAFLSAGGVWTNASSRESKRDIAKLSGSDALEALQGMNPVTFRYKEEPDEQYVGFIAEDLPDLVATNDHKHMSSMDVVAVLTKVVKDQQKTIDELSARLADLEEKEK